jgi:hypothetical protein
MPSIAYIMINSKRRPPILIRAGKVTKKVKIVERRA